MGDRKIYCTNCGSPIDSEWKYCRNCGHPVCVENMSEQKPIGYYSPTQESVAQPKEKRPGSGAGIVAFFICLVLVVGAMIYASSNKQVSSPSSRATPKPTKIATSTPTPKPTSTLKPVSVYNGELIRVPGYEGQCPFTVSTTTESGGYYVYLKYLRNAPNSTEQRILKKNAKSSSDSDISFYISAGKSVKISVPVGVYKFYYAYGETWYGETDHFGSNTIYYESDDLLTFYTEDDGDSRIYNGHTIELWLQTDGNFDTDKIPKKDFPG